MSVRYKVFWRSETSSAGGYSEWLYDKEEAEVWVAEGNRRCPDMPHELVQWDDDDV